MPLIIPPGSMIRPLVKALNPIAPSIKSGSRSIIEKFTICMMTISSVPIVNIGYLKALISSMGSFKFNCLKPNRIRAITLITNGTTKKDILAAPRLLAP